jgi:hypothetical protein
MVAADTLASRTHRAEDVDTVLGGHAAAPVGSPKRPRDGEYAEAVAESDALTGAAAIELRALAVDDLIAYLPRTTRVTAGGTSLPGTTKWDPVLARDFVSKSILEAKAAAIQVLQRLVDDVKQSQKKTQAS